jgi:hypothetical protein
MSGTAEKTALDDKRSEAAFGRDCILESITGVLATAIHIGQTTVVLCSIIRPNGIELTRPSY